MAIKSKIKFVSKFMKMQTIMRFLFKFKQKESKVKAYWSSRASVQITEFLKDYFLKEMTPFKMVKPKFLTIALDKFKNAKKFDIINEKRPDLHVQ